MATFRDCDGREWTVRVTVATVARVKDQTGVDLLEAGEIGSDLFERLTRDPVLCWRVICAVVRPQLDERGVAPEQLAEAMGETEWEQAFLALVEGVIDFFREPKRGLLRQTWTRALAAKQKVEQAAKAQTEAILASGELERTIEELALQAGAVANASGSSSGSSQASQDSTPGPAPSESSSGPQKPNSAPNGTARPPSSP